MNLRKVFKCIYREKLPVLNDVAYGSSTILRAGEERVCPF